MTIRYSLSYADWHDFHEAVTPEPRIDLKSYYFFVTAKTAILLTLAYLSFVALNQYLLGLAALYLAVDYLRATVPHTKYRKQLIESESSRKSDHFIELEIADSGMTETAFGIVSYCPWKSVTKVEKFKGVVIVHLTSGLFAIISSLALESLKMDPVELVALIESKRQACKNVAVSA